MLHVAIGLLDYGRIRRYPTPAIRYLILLTYLLGRLHGHSESDCLSDFFLITIFCFRLHLSINFYVKITEWCSSDLHTESRNKRQRSCHILTASVNCRPILISDRHIRCNLNYRGWKANHTLISDVLSSVFGLRRRSGCNLTP